ncbi:MAG: hypothetical protein AB8H86_26240 [Polyangiales bacterium]
MPSRKRSLVATLFFVAAWLFVFPYFERMNNPNENVRLYMTAALVDDGSYEISNQRQRWGWVNDAACTQPARPGVEGFAEGELMYCEGRPGGARKYYSVKAPLTSWLGIPGYVIAKWLGGEELTKASAIWWVRLFGTGIPCAIFLFFFYGFLGRVTSSPMARDLSFLAFALGSVFLGYSYLFASHSTSAVAAGGAFIILAHFHRQKRDGFRAETKKQRSGAWLLAALAGFLTAGCTALEYPCLLFSVAFSLYALVAIRPFPRILAFGVGALIPTLLVAHFQWSAFGNPLSPGHLFVENAAFRAGHEQGFFGADGFHWEAAASLLFAPREGLFTTTPFFLFALLGLAPLWKRYRVAASFAGAASLLTYLAICLMGNWDGGWVIGPRYLVVLLPFVAIASAAGLESAERKAPILTGYVASTLIIMSFAVAGTLSVFYPHVPAEIIWPMSHMVWPVLSEGRAPHNALELLGMVGSWTMLPLVFLALGSLVWAQDKKTKWRAPMWVVAGVFTAAALYATSIPEMGDAARPALDAVHSLWEP